jgi:hypothetical protein
MRQSGSASASKICHRRGPVSTRTFRNHHRLSGIANQTHRFPRRTHAYLRLRAYGNPLDELAESVSQKRVLLVAPESYRIARKVRANSQLGSVWLVLLSMMFAKYYIYDNGVNYS